LAASEVDVSWDEVLQAFVTTMAIVMIDQGLNLSHEVTGEAVVLQQNAVLQVVFEELKPDGGEGGLIAIDRSGEVVMLYNTDGMVRGRTTGRLSTRISTYLDD